MSIQVQAIDGLVLVFRRDNFDYKDLTGDRYLAAVNFEIAKHGHCYHPDEAATFLDTKRWGGVIAQARQQNQQAKAKRIAELEAELVKLKGPQV